MATAPKQFPVHTEEEDLALRSPPGIRGTAEESSVDVRWYLDALRRRLAPIAIVVVLAAAIGFVLASLRPLAYEGVTTLLIVPAPQPVGPQFTPATFRAMVENASLVSQVIDELKLQQRLHVTYALTPQNFLERALTVEELRATNIVKVKVTLPDAELAAATSRRVAEKAILLTQQITQLEGESIQDQLKKHLDGAQQRLRTAEQQLLTYKQGAQVELIKGDTDADLRARSQLLELTVNIAAEQARLAAAEQEIRRQSPLLQSSRMPAADEALRRTAEVPPVPRADRPGNPGDPLTRGEVDASHLDLSNPYVNPIYQTLDFQISMTRARIAALEKQRDELVNVKKIGGKELSQLSELYRRQIEQARLQASFDLALRVFSELSLKYEQSRTQQLGNLAQLQVVDAAIPPDRPVSRRRVWQALAFGSAGFLIATLAVVLLARRG